MNKIDHLSVSQVSMFSRCEFQWFLKYIENITIPVHSALIRGKAVHSGLSSIFLTKQTNNDYNPDEIIDIVVRSIEHSEKEQEVIWDKPKSQIKDVVVKLISSYIKDKHPDKIRSEDIESVESKFSYELFTDKGESFTIVGYPDLVLKDRVIDFKTSSRKPSKIDLINKFQTAFYSTVCGKSKTELQYLVSKKEPETYTLISNIDKEIKSISRIVFIKVYNKLMQSLHSGNFLPTGLFHPWVCNYCGYNDQGKCPYHISTKSKIA